MKLPLRLKIFTFLIAPTELWIHIMAFICGITYINDSKFEDVE